jgi:hypothetical protein
MGRSCSADGQERGVYRVLMGNLRERDQWGDPDVGGRIILGWIYKEVGCGGIGLDLAGS